MKKLISVDEGKLETLLMVLDPLIVQLRSRGDIDQADNVIGLKKYLRSRIETAPGIPTASTMGQKGGLSRSHRKLDAIKKNAAKAGPPGTYFARLIIEPSTNDESLTQVIHYFFGDRRKRDEWLTGPGRREALLSIAPSIKALKQRDPEAIADGDRRLLAQLEEERMLAQLDRPHDTAEDCDGCGDLMERKEKAVFGANSLCPNCVAAIRGLACS